MPASSVRADIPTKEATFVPFALFVVETDAFASPLTTIAPGAPARTPVLLTSLIFTTRCAGDKAVILQRPTLNVQLPTELRADCFRAVTTQVPARYGRRVRL